MNALVDEAILAVVIFVSTSNARSAKLKGNPSEENSTRGVIRMCTAPSVPRLA